MNGAERDRGLAAERTELAWGRSALALFACGAAVAKGIPNVTPTHRHAWIGIVVLLLGGLVWLAGIPLARARARSVGVRRVATFTDLAPLAFGTAVVGVAAFVIGAFFPG